MSYQYINSAAALQGTGYKHPSCQTASLDLKKKSVFVHHFMITPMEICISVEMSTRVQTYVSGKNWMFKMLHNAVNLAQNGYLHKPVLLKLLISAFLPFSNFLQFSRIAI